MSERMRRTRWVGAVCFALVGVLNLVVGVQFHSWGNEVIGLAVLALAGLHVGLLLPVRKRGPARGDERGERERGGRSPRSRRETLPPGS